MTRLDEDDLSLAELRDWAMDVAGPFGAQHEKSEVMSLIHGVIERDPEDAEAHFSLGFAIYHLFRDASPALLTEGLEALRRAQALDFGDSWSRLYELYLLWECRNLHACVAASALLDREVFLATTNWAWRAISADEIEFAALAELGLGGTRLSNLAARIVTAAKKEQSGLSPFVPYVFAKALDVAVEHSLLPRVEAERFRADVAPLVERA